MLRITTCREADSEIEVLTVEGALAGPWVPVLREAVEAPPNGMGRQVVLDLDGVLFVDADGAALLSELKARSVVFARCSRFVAEILRTESHDAD